MRDQRQYDALQGSFGATRLKVKSEPNSNELEVAAERLIDFTSMDRFSVLDTSMKKNKSEISSAGSHLEVELFDKKNVGRLSQSKVKVFRCQIGPVATSHFYRLDRQRYRSKQESRKVLDCCER